MAEKALKIIPLGGFGEIGKNMLLLEYEEDIIIIDSGVMFPDATLPGVDLVLPNFSYCLENQKKIKAIFVTHGHEDHIGGIPYLMEKIKVPLYATALTIGMIKNKLSEFSLNVSDLLRVIKPRERLDLGHFSIEFINVNHSIIGSVSLAITTPLGVIIHTGDIKIDSNPVDQAYFDYYSFAKYGESGVLLLMSDSTNSGVEGYTSSESDIGKRIQEIFEKASGRVILASFASNIHRIQQVMNSAKATGRKVALSGLSMIKNIEMAFQLGFLEYDPEDLIELSEMKNYSDHAITIITTGSQGELMSALSRIANKKHSHIRLAEGDTVIISASVIPGNEKAVSNIVNKLLIMGATVQHEQGRGGEGIHVSGHASREELKTIINLTRPRYFMPIHGEYRHLLQHADLALELNIPRERIMVARNGEIIKLGKNFIKKSGNVPAEPVYVDGKIHGDIGINLLKERTDLAQSGMMVVILKLSLDGFLIEEPRIIHKGFIYEKEGANFSAKVKDHLEKSLGHLRESKRKKGLEGKIKNSLRKFLFAFSGRSPVIEVEIFYEDL